VQEACAVINGDAEVRVFINGAQALIISQLAGVSVQVFL
jgi:hypothetical protein